VLWKTTSFHDVIWVCNIIFSHILSSLSLTVLSGYILPFCQDIFYRFVRIYFTVLSGYILPFCLDIFYRFVRIYFTVLSGYILPFCQDIFYHFVRMYFTVLSGYILPFCQDIFFRFVRICSINIAGPMFCLTYVFAFCITEKIGITILKSLVMWNWLYALAWDKITGEL